MEKLYVSRNLFSRLFLVLLLSLISAFAYSQLPSFADGINYQAVARDTSGNPITSSTNLAVRFSIWNDSVGGSPLANFNEVHSPVNTNRYGLFSLVIGSIDSVNFRQIPWEAPIEKYIQVEIAIVGGSSYMAMKRSPLMSVPYALFSKHTGDAWRLAGNTITDTLLFLGTTNPADLIIKTNNAERMRIKSGGAVGIGNSNPHAMLDVMSIGNTSSSFSLGVRNSDTAYIMAVRDDGKVGIGNYEPKGTLDVMGAGNSSNTYGFGVRNADSVYAIVVQDDGKIGIGTNFPDTTLHINGTVKITDGTEGLKKVLTSSSDGTASWVMPDTGTVLSFNADSLAPLFTTTVSNDSVNPYLDFTLTDAPAYTVFGNNTSATGQPSYVDMLSLTSPLFRNEGAANTVLHGNTSGNLSWSSINLSNDISGTLPIANGGTNATAIGPAGSVPYSTGTAYSFTAAGPAGNVLVSNGSSSPLWSKRVLKITGGGTNGAILATTNDTANYSISVADNGLNTAGVVAAGSGNNNKVWKTNSSGAPGWRDAFIAGNGLSTNGDTIHTLWTQVGFEIRNNNYGNVDIVGGNLFVNALNNGNYVGFNGNTDTTNRIRYSSATSSLWFESNGQMYFNKGFNANGNVGIGNNIGTASPSSTLYVKNATTTGSTGYFENTNTASVSPTLVTYATSSANALYVSQDGTGRGELITINNSSNGNSGLEISTNGGNLSKGIYVSHTGNGGTDYAAYFSSTGSATGTTNIGGYFNAQNASNNYAAIFDHGYVGIGTTTPLTPLHIIYNNPATLSSGITLQNTNSATTALTSIALFNDAGAGGGLSINSSTNITVPGAANGMNIGTNNATKLFIATNNLPRMTIDASGNVGIGTVSPASMFHSAGQIRTGIPFGGLGGSLATLGSILFYNPSNTNTVSIQSGVTSAPYTLTLPTAQGGSNTYLKNDGSGGLSWATLSAVSGSGTASYIPKWNASSALTNSIMYDSGTKIGIGTSTPGTTLEINGGLTYSPTSVAISLGTILTPGNSSYIQMTASGGGPTIVGFSGTGAVTGQVLILQYTGTSGNISVASGTGVRLNGALPYLMGPNDTLTLIFDGNNWIETGRSDN